MKWLFAGNFSQVSLNVSLMEIIFALREKTPIRKKNEVMKIHKILLINAAKINLMDTLL